MKAKRVYVTATVAAVLLAAFLLLPLPISRVREAGLVGVDPGNADAIGLIEPAHLVDLPVREGQAVKKGQVLARFGSRDLAEKRAQAESKRDEQQAVRDALTQALSAVDPKSRDKVEADRNEATRQAESFAAQVDEVDAELRLVSDLVAPRDGVVMGLPKRSEVGKLFDRNYQQGKPVCTVGDPTRLVVKIPVGPAEYKTLREDLTPAGLPVALYVTGRTDHEFAGVIRRLPESDTKQLPVPLTQRGGGPIAVKQSGEGGQEVSPVSQVYLVEIDLTDPDATVKPGVLVKAKVHCQWRTAAWWVKRKLSEALDIGLY